MKKIVLLAILFLSINMWSQPYNLKNYQFINLGKYLLNSSDNKIITSFDKNYFSSLQAYGKVVVSDSEKVYFLENSTYTFLKAYTLNTDPLDFIKLTYVQSDTNSTLYAFARRTFDTLKIFKFRDTTLVDTILLDSVSSPVNIVYTDSAHFLLTFANVRNENGSAYFTFRFIKFGINGILSDDTVRYTSLGENYLFPTEAIALTQNQEYMVIVSSGKTYVFRLNSQHNVLSVAKYNFTSPKISLANNQYLFIADGQFVYRINMATQQVNGIDVLSNVKTILYTPSANLLIAYYGIADTSLAILYSPLVDSMNNVYFDYVNDNYSSQPGGVFYYNYTRPWFDFDWQADGIQKGKYIFSAIDGVGFEPDSINWYINGHFIGYTTKGNHSIEHIFFRSGFYKIKASGYYNAEDDSVIVEHYIKTYYDMFPNIIPQDTIFLCDIPDFYIDLVNYSLGNDSIVWFRNHYKYDILRNQSYAHITKPGEYWVYIYLPDTVLSDTVHVYYLDKEFSEQTIKLYVNDRLYDPDNYIYCTNDGNIYFKFELPHTPYCPQSYLVYWYFGDDRVERSSELYTDHKYYDPGIYTVMVNIRNLRTGAAYNYIFPIQVSINPISKYPKVATIQKLENYRFYIGYDYEITKQKILQNNIFYSTYGHQIYDSATITIPIDDPNYHSRSYNNYTFWALLSSPIAEGIEIRLFNSQGDSITLMPNQDTTFPATSFFYGRPKIDIPDFPHKNESAYPYFWNDESSLTFWYMTHTTPSTTGIFDVFDYFIEEYEIFDWHHYQLYPATLHPYGIMSSLSSDSLGSEWKAKFIVHPKNPQSDHIFIQAIGLRFGKYSVDNHYTYSWSGDIPSRTYQDTIVEVISEFEGKYTLKFSVTDNFGCTYSENTLIYVLDTLGSVLPDIFTPNGDGFNDRWDLRRAFYKQIYEENAPVQVKIWDQYGRVVAEFLVNDVKEWDGTDKNGRLLPPGTYWYLITVANKQHYRGYITILY